MSDKKTMVADGSKLAVAGDEEARVTVNKAYKMYVGGAFIRSESGRYFQVQGHGGADPETVNVPRGSRKDVRDAVLIAKNAWDSWASRTAYNRGQILYRLAEVMESRSEELVTSLARSGISKDARLEVRASIDRVVFYAGFCDKFQALVASSNPVAGPHFGFSVPESMGVVGVCAPEQAPLLGLVSTVLPPIAGGNTVVALASELDPRTAIVFSECLATSDLPGGVINILTGQAAEVVGALVKHREVIAMDVWANDLALRTEVEKLASDNVKRVKTHDPANVVWENDRQGQGLGFIENFLETKTVWHPVGL